MCASRNNRSLRSRLGARKGVVSEPRLLGSGRSTRPGYSASRLRHFPRWRWWGDPSYRVSQHTWRSSAPFRGCAGIAMTHGLSWATLFRPCGACVRTQCRNVRRTFVSWSIWEPRFLLLLCYKRATPQKGHRGHRASRAWARRTRRVTIEFGLCRSGRTRAAGPVVRRRLRG